MLNDLSASFLNEMDKATTSPFQLMIFHFESGDVYLSDKDRFFEGHFYRGLLENWGELGTVGDVDSVNSTMVMTISIWNGGMEPFSKNFIENQPTNTFVEVYQSFEGLTFAESALIGEFVIQEPIENKEKSRLLSLDLVTTNMRYLANINDVMTRFEYPKALASDVNKSIDLIVGNCGEVQCLCSHKPAFGTLKGSFLKRTTKIHIHEDIDKAGFARSVQSYLKIDEEIMGYTWADNTNGFSITSRGQFGTVATEHIDGTEVFQAQSYNEYIIGKGGLSEANNVRIKGQIPTIPYTVHINQNPAVIRFVDQPVYIEYSKTASRKEEQFDSTHSVNTAELPHYSYDPEKKALGAIINKNHRALTISKTIEAVDKGEIVKVFLYVEHWCTKAYSSDYLDVLVGGLTNPKVGTLNRPNENDMIAMGGDVDLMHGHGHSIGGQHDHDSIDPQDSIDESPHAHGLDQAGTDNILLGGNYNGQWDTFQMRSPNAPEDNSKWYSVLIPRSNLSSDEIMKEEVYLELEMYGCNIEVWGGVRCQSGHTPPSGSGIYCRALSGPTATVRTNAYQPNKTVSTNVIPLLPFGAPPGKTGNKYIFWIRIFHQSMTEPIPYPHRRGAYLHVAKIKTFTKKPTGLLDTHDSSSNVLLNRIASGIVTDVNQNTNVIKGADDVSDLEESERIKTININMSENSSRSIVQKFDITSRLTKVDWKWLNKNGEDRNIQINYMGSAEDVSVIVTNISFNIEYRVRQVLATDVVTCEPIGLINNRPDAVIQHLLQEYSKLPTSKLSSVYRDLPRWDDTKIWDDTEIWLDGGSVANVPQGALFEEASAWFSLRNYGIDGVLTGSVKTAIERITFQTRSRLLWQNGKCKLVILKKASEWISAKTIVPEETQLKSFSSKRTTLNDLINNINLYYGVDRNSLSDGAGKYSSMVSKVDLKSIEKNGEKLSKEDWLFDLIRNDTMADHIADYYIWELGEIATYYIFTTYLNNFNLEKDEKIQISAKNFESLLKVPVVIKEIVREFGSGKDNKINTIKIISKSIRRVILESSANDDANISESLNIAIGDSIVLSEQAVLRDILSSFMGFDVTEDINISETTEILMSFVDSLTDNFTLGEAATFDFNVDLDDSVTADESLGLSDKVCFSACGFGTMPFGSPTVVREAVLDITSSEDVLSMDIGKQLSDDITMVDTLLISDCFGSKIGDGFGLTPFGY